MVRSIVNRIVLTVLALLGVWLIVVVAGLAVSVPIREPDVTRGRVEMSSANEGAWTQGRCIRWPEP